MTDETTEKSALEKSFEAMSPEQFETAAAMLNKEHARRDDPFKRLGSMTDRELDELKDRFDR